MNLLNVAELKQEMVLSEDLVNSYGRFLLAKGTRLSTKHLRILKMWGVAEVNVVGHAPTHVQTDSTPYLDPAIIKAAEAEMSRRFYYVDLEHAAGLRLYNICRLRKAEAISKNQPAAPENHISECPGKPDRKDTCPAPVAPIDPETLIHEGLKLPSLPQIYEKIDAVIRHPNSSANDIGRVISTDISLSVRLLKLVNSAFYGFPSQIDTLSRAVSIVGTKQLSTLAIGMNIMNVFKDIPAELVDMRQFWTHSIACGICARVIGNCKNMPNTERLFVGGLLHDVGRLLLFSQKPDAAKKVLARARETRSLLYKTEKEMLDCDHAAIGGVLIRKWGLPLSLENIVIHHHAPQAAQDSLEPAIVHLADMIANAVGIGSSGERSVPPLDPVAWQCVDISTNMLDTIVTQTLQQVEETKEFLSPEV